MNQKNEKMIVYRLFNQNGSFFENMVILVIHNFSCRYLRTTSYGSVLACKNVPHTVFVHHDAPLNA